MLPAWGWGTTQPPLPRHSHPHAALCWCHPGGCPGFFGGASSTPLTPWGWEGDVSIPWAAPDTPFLGCRNSYSLYCAELMANMKDVPSTERMVLCSQQWKLLSQKEKDAYHKKCDQVGSGEKGQEEFGVGRSPPPPAFLGAGPRCPQSVPSLGCVHVGAARGGWGMLVVLLLGGGSASTRGSSRAGGRSLHNPVSPPLPPPPRKRKTTRSSCSASWR